MRTSPSHRCRAAIAILVATIAAAAFAAAPAKSKLPQPRESRTYLGRRRRRPTPSSRDRRRRLLRGHRLRLRRQGDRRRLRGTFKNGRVSLNAKDGTTLKGTLTRSKLTLPGKSPLKAKRHLSPFTDNEHFIVGVGEAGRRTGRRLDLLANGRQRGAIRAKSGTIHPPIPPVRLHTTTPNRFPKACA